MSKITRYIENGCICYYNNEIGQPHSEDGPAMIWSDGHICYCKNGSYHRTDGPALIHPDGSCKFAIDGNFYYRGIDENEIH